MKRLALGFLMVLLMVSFAWGDSYEAVTVDSTSGGVSLTAATYGRARYALMRLETAPIRYTMDGSTAPTTEVGVQILPFEWIVLDNPFKIKNFRAIRTGDTSATLFVFYFN